ncbi:MAG TPA: hypothetical protein VNN62_25035 [Methylomirabilota bacterium]|jgi:hypothetical protein|nr:hypothetical protein [Methylomirabilota bacterium]
MSDERGNRPPVDEQIPGEVRLSRVYRQAEEERPPTHLDALVLTAARKAVRTPARKIWLFPTRKWSIPLALAAALVVTFQVVMMRLDAPQYERRLAQQPASVPAMGPGPVPGKQIDSAAGTALSMKSARDEVQDAAQEKMENKPPAPAPGQLTAEEQGKEYINKLEISPKTLHKQTEPLLPNSTLSLSAPAPVTHGEIEVEEERLSPERWIAKIKELRRAGKHAEAKASLQALKKQYPKYPAERLLQEQPEALRAPKE